MNRTDKINSKFKAGMYLLETLSSGMYNEPLSIYREYIQNAVDSIDAAKRIKPSANYAIKIDLDPFNKSISIFDNGYGISSRKAEEVLSGIGSSSKKGSGSRGFRGIGRLGGLAFSKRVIFRTKSKGDKYESIQEWDCLKLNAILSDNKYKNMSLKQLFNKVTTFKKAPHAKTSESFFNVTLEGVSSFRNYIFDIKKIHEYISQIAPLPFSSEFTHSKKVNYFLNHNLERYNYYNIFLNGTQILKPYKSKIKISKGFDTIEEIKTFQLLVDDESKIFGWYGIRKDLSGSISRQEHCSGIRVRVGNILLGDEHLLDRCFREPRFNNYIIGEIHVESKSLTPNSRRDDFVDNKIKTEFYNQIEKIVGLPISKEIRFKSKMNSDNKINELKYKNQKPYIKLVITKNNQEFNSKVITLKNIPDGIPASKILNELLNKCIDCNKLESVLREIEKSS